MTPSDRSRRWAAVLLALYATLMATLVLAPRPIEEGPVPVLRGVLARWQRSGLPGWIGYDVVELASHVALFVPLGILTLVALGRTSAWLGVVAALGAAGLVEFAQSLLVADHPPSVLDVLTNSIGAVIGAAIGYRISPARQASRRTRPSDTHS